MKTILLLICSLASVTAFADSSFKIDVIVPTRAWLYVDDVWQEGTECVEVKVAVAKATDAKGIMVKAYFFSMDGKLLEIVDRPTSMADGAANQIKSPLKYEVGRKYSHYFAVPTRIKAGADKWKRVVVVFGSADSMAAKIYPKDDMAKFEFPEKKTATVK